MTGIVGCAGLLPTVAAIEAGKDICLANKETLIAGERVGVWGVVCGWKGCARMWWVLCAPVMMFSCSPPKQHNNQKQPKNKGGPFVLPLAAKHNVKILPADSEHSAIFQVMQGLPPGGLRRIILTASGGAFRDWPVERLASVTVEQVRGAWMFSRAFVCLFVVAACHAARPNTPPQNHAPPQKLTTPPPPPPKKTPPPHPPFCLNQQQQRHTHKKAITHPNWSMGKKITIDSATLMNKGLEVRGVC